jgi:lipid-binding SYLF domain-containing protein
MKASLRALMLTITLALAAAPALADDADTIALFKGAGRSAGYFDTAYGYAVFPNIGKAGFIVGGARGEGHVYQAGERVGETTMNQLSIGFQLGGTDYAEVIFFRDSSAFNDFTSGSFEFDANAQVTAVTASAGASAGTNGAQSSASGGEHDAATGGGYYKGMAVFTVTRGGLMYEASIAGQKFSYTPLSN